MKKTVKIYTSTADRLAVLGKELEKKFDREVSYSEILRLVIDIAKTRTAIYGQSEKKNLKNTSFYLPTAHWQWIEKTCRENNITRASLLDALVNIYGDRLLF